MQQEQITNTPSIADLQALPAGRRVIAIDPGTKKIGVAISDDTQLLARPLPRIERKSWKKLLLDIKSVVQAFDAAAAVVGLPLESSGAESPMSAEARDIARKLALSLEIPVFLQDERVSSYEARGRIWKQGRSVEEAAELVDSEAACIILEDFLNQLRASRKP